MNTRSWVPKQSTASHWSAVFCGQGIDVSDADHSLALEQWPAITACERFDLSSENIVHIGDTRARECYDFIYGCRFLEKAGAPARALAQCWSLIKPSGYLALVVADEDLFEQGRWPSRFDPRHRWTFSLHKSAGEQGSWSPRSINLLHLILENLNGFRFVLVRLDDTDYDYAIRGLDQTLPPNNAGAHIECILQKLPSQTYATPSQVLFAQDGR